MKFTLTSPSGTVIETSDFLQATVMTETWEITILPDHEALLSVVRPGILKVTYKEKNTEKQEEYALGGGVLHIDADTCTIVSDLVQGEFKDDDLEDIKRQKEEAEQMIADYNAGKNPIDPKRQMEIEYELLKNEARYELLNKLKTSDGSRK